MREQNEAVPFETAPAAQISLSMLKKINRSVEFSGPAVVLDLAPRLVENDEGTWL